jgi:uncharacterized RDD family membrane protein YckC
MSAQTFHYYFDIQFPLAQSIDLLLFYLGYQAFYGIVNADSPMAYDRLFNGVDELLEFISIWVMYSFALEWVTRGDSVEKWALGLQDVKINGNSIGFREVYHRWPGNWFDFYLSGVIWAVIAVFVSLQCQRIGDYWAKRVVSYV